jgi:hypothetical protein
VNATLAAPPGLADLVLVRMTLPRATPANVRRDVGKLLDTEVSAAELANLCGELASVGLVEKQSRNRYRVTDAGRERVLRFLGLSDLPASLNWSRAVSQHLFPIAARMSADAAARLNTGDKLAAYMLKRKYGLPDDAGSSVSRVLEAVVCHEVGFPEETTLAGLLRAVLSKRVGSGERLTKDQLAQQLPRFETGVRSLGADEIRRKLLRDWLAGAAAAGDEALPGEPFDLPAFAATVLALAGRSPPQDRFHDNKVFIAPLWAASQREPNFPRLSLPEFKRRLVEANSKHLVHLSRADLVQAMDPRLVSESETQHLNATFHFVLLEGGRP